MRKRRVARLTEKAARSKAGARRAAAGRAVMTAAPMAALAHEHAHPHDLNQVTLARHLFWQNVVREMLTGLSMLQVSQPEVFDGRMGVLTNAGERIPIAEVFPMFACGVPGSAADRAASIAVECTVFRIRTPSGEMFTLPLHEIRGLHALTPELLKELEQSSIERMVEADDEKKRPFGLAAFTTLGTGEEAEEDEGEAEAAI